jgi:general secretion pathway protein D
MRTIARVLLLVLLVTASATAADPPRSVVLNFDNADVEVVVQAVAEIVGFNYVFGPNVRGRKVTVQTVGKISREDLLPFLLTILDANGLAAVQTDGVYRIITREGASQTPVRTVVGREAAPGPAGGEIITQVVPLAFLSAADAVTMLRPYVAAEGSLSAHRETNLLIVTDTASNIRRLLDIIKVMDVPVALEEPQIIPLQYADAQEIAQLLNQMFVTGRARGGGGAIVSPGVPAAPPAQGAPPAPRAPIVGGEAGGSPERPPLIIAERRSNSLVVHARRQDLEAIRRLVERLDVNMRGGQQVFVYFAENTKARDLATTLDAIYGLWQEIQETIKQIDKMPRQVLIQVLAVEVTLTDDTKLGMDWAVRSGKFTATSSPSGLLPGIPPQSLIPLGGPVPAGLSMFAFATDRFLAALNALATHNLVNVLSNPSVMTTENKKAVINVSTSVPIVTSQQVPVATGGITGNAITQTVEYRDAGVILTVTPRIGEQGTVALEVKQEVNEVGQNEPPPINSPRFTKREAETSVVLMNNQTLVLGGLIQNRRTTTQNGVPFLHRIPILGFLFGFKEERIEKTELVLVITPRVVGTALEAARITDEMRRATPDLEESIRRAPRTAPPLIEVPPPPPPAPPRPPGLD